MRGQKWPNAPLTPPFSTPGAAPLLSGPMCAFFAQVQKKKFYFIFNKKTVSSDDNTVPMIVMIMRRDGRGRKR